MSDDLDITFEKLDKLDLCFEDISGENLYERCKCRFYRFKRICARGNKRLY